MKGAGEKEGGDVYQLGSWRDGDGGLEEVLETGVEKVAELEMEGGDELVSGVVQAFLLATQGRRKMTKEIVKALLNGCLKMAEGEAEEAEGKRN